MEKFKERMIDAIGVSKLNLIDLDSAFAIVRSMHYESIISKIEYHSVRNGNSQEYYVSKQEALSFLYDLATKIWHENECRFPNLTAANRIQIQLSDFKNSKRRRQIEFVL